MLIQIVCEAQERREGVTFFGEGAVGEGVGFVEAERGKRMEKGSGACDCRKLRESGWGSRLSEIG